MDERKDDESTEVRRAIELAAYVFYKDGRWSPFDLAVGESRVTQPDGVTRVQFNNLPGRGAHAEYRGPYGYWWVRIDADTGMPAGDPVFVPAVDRSSRLVN